MKKSKAFLEGRVFFTWFYHTYVVYEVMWSFYKFKILIKEKVVGATHIFLVVCALSYGDEMLFSVTSL